VRSAGKCVKVVPEVSAMTLAEILNNLTTLDCELQELEKQRTAAHNAANVTEVNRLEVAMYQLKKARYALRRERKWKQPID
jgi:hypothetical protein